jgi:hypothetical protein
MSANLEQKFGCPSDLLILEDNLVGMDALASTPFAWTPFAWTTLFIERTADMQF